MNTKNTTRISNLHCCAFNKRKKNMASYIKDIMLVIFLAIILSFWKRDVGQ